MVIYNHPNHPGRPLSAALRQATAQAHQNESNQKAKT
jgi:hypothetical protein